jgi:hypothetical protein
VGAPCASELRSWAPPVRLSFARGRPLPMSYCLPTYLAAGPAQRLGFLCSTTESQVALRNIAFPIAFSIHPIIASAIVSHLADATLTPLPCSAALSTP